MVRLMILGILFILLIFSLQLSFSNSLILLYDNSPLVTYQGACSGDDASRLQGSMSVFGFGHQASAGIHSESNKIYRELQK